MDFFSLSQTLPHFFNAGSKNSAENNTFAIPNDTFTIVNDTFAILNVQNNAVNQRFMLTNATFSVVKAALILHYLLHGSRPLSQAHGLQDTANRNFMTKYSLRIAWNSPTAILVSNTREFQNFIKTYQSARYNLKHF